MMFTQQQPIMYVEADSQTLRWAEKWHTLGFGRRLWYSMLDSERANRASMIANGQAVVAMPQQYRRPNEGPFTRWANRTFTS